MLIFLGPRKIRVAQNSCNLCYLIGIKKMRSSSFSLHKSVYVSQFFWTQLKPYTCKVRVAEGRAARGHIITDTHDTSHSAYVATSTKSYGVKIDGLLTPNFL